MVIWPRRSNIQATEPVVPRLPPLRDSQRRMSATVRFPLSVSDSIMMATPAGPYASYVISS
jgi:hypothetical protein